MNSARLARWLKIDSSHRRTPGARERESSESTLFWIPACAGMTESWPARLVLLLALGYHGAAGAAVTCEQLADIAFATQRLRDQGDSLQVLLAEADKLESSRKFTADDLVYIKGVVELTFRSIRSPLEVLQECKDKPPRLTGK